MPSSPNRREFIQAAGGALAGACFLGLPAEAGAANAASSSYDWIRRARIVIAEGYNAPFYPVLDYRPARAVRIAQELNADGFRFPAAAYCAYFPTRSGYPIHPELKEDLMRETLVACRDAGIRPVGYVPLNHPFMAATSSDARYAGWSRKFADGRPMITSHYGYGRFFEGCLNSPLRRVIKTMVREVLVEYPFDVLFFDGPYEGSENGSRYCHCRYCEAAYRAKFGRPVPDDRTELSREDQVQYVNWMANDVVIAFLREIREMIRRTRDVPVLFNDTALLSRRQWRNRAIPAADGFMFEAADGPESKLFNLQLGRSTGKTVWTYIGTYADYNQEHLQDHSVRGWYSYPLEGEELLMDGAVAVTGGAGLLYWSMSRFYFQPDGPLVYPSGRYVKRTFDLQQRHGDLLGSLEIRPQAGILVSDQTIDWYAGKTFVNRAFGNCYHGAYRLLKANSYESEPFLDWQMSPERLARYSMIYVPSAACLSDAQCAMLQDYVSRGGRLLATHLTSVADEYGRVRPNFGLSALFGASFLDPEPVEIPDLYLRLPSGEEIPQDPQVLRFRVDAADVLAETIDRGRREVLGPAIASRRFGRGSVLYIGSSLEAIYEETRMDVLRRYFDSLVSPWLAACRSYLVPYRAGLTPHFLASPDTLLLHLLANTGDKDRHSAAREEFLPIPDVQARIRVPEGRSIRSVSLLQSGQALPAPVRAGWLEVTVDAVHVHEAIRVDLA